MRRFAALAAGCALIAPSCLAAAPFTVSDVLAAEKMGAVEIDPAERWAVVQHFARWDSAPRYDLDAATQLGLSRLRVFDLAKGGAERPIALPAGPGYIPAGLSPGGKRLAVYRIVGHAVELGVIDLTTGQTRWLGVVPRLPSLGRTLAWRGDDELIVATRPPEAIDGLFGWGWLVQSRLPPMWEAAAQGQAAVSVLGAGRWRGLRGRPPVGALERIDLTTGAREVLLAGDVADLELSPDGSTLAALVNGEDLPPPKEPLKADEALRRRRLMLVDLASRKVSEPLPGQDVMIRLLSWSPTSRGVLVFARDPAKPWSDGDYVVAGKSGDITRPALQGARPALDGTMFNGALARGAWLADAPVVRLRIGERADWWRLSPDGAVNLTAALQPGAQLAVVGERRLLMRAGGDLWTVGSGAPRRLPRGTQLRTTSSALLGDRGGYVGPPLARTAFLSPRRSLKGANGDDLGAPVYGESLLAIAPRRDLRLTSIRDEHGVETLILAGRQAPARPLMTLNIHLAHTDFALALPIRHRGLDGETLTSWLYLPRGADIARPAPLVVIPYPGQNLARPPSGQAAPAFARITNAQLLVGLGYAALVPAVPIRPGKAPAEGLAAQILLAVDAAAAQTPVDANRLALYGHSYGGYAVVTAATQSPRFKAIIAAAATSNLTSAYGRQPPATFAAPEAVPSLGTSVAWMETGQTRMGVAPWVDPQRYVDASPIFRADRITAPVLMIYGDLDNDVTQPQGLFAALYRQDKDAIFAIYRGESHVAGSPGNVRDLHQRIETFLRDTIGPGLPP